MDNRQFVNVIKEIVRDAAISDTLQILEHPPGRQPSKELRERADWYRLLNRDQRKSMHRTVEQAVDIAVFGLLGVLDGVRPAEGGSAKGNFELRYVKEGVTLLDPPDGSMLHDLYNAACVEPTTRE